MFRWVLAACLCLQSLMGLSPCCCLAARVVAAESDQATASGEAAPLTCCHQPAAGVSAEEAATADQPAEDCTCETSQCDALPPRSSDVEIACNRWWTDELALNLYVPLTIETEVISSLTGLAEALSAPAARSGRQIRIEYQSWLS